MGFGKDVQAVNPYTATDAPFYAGLQMQQDAINTTAAQYDEQARIAAQESRRQAELVARQARGMANDAYSAYGFSGIDPTQGTPINTARMIAKNAQEDVNAYINQGLATAKQLRTQGYLTRQGGRADILGSYTNYSMGKLGAATGAIRPGGFGNFLGQAMSGLSGALYSKAAMGGGGSILDPLKKYGTALGVMLKGAPGI